MLKLHFSFKDIDAADYLKNITIPVLITNADQDTLTPPHMGEALFEAVPHEKNNCTLLKDSNMQSSHVKIPPPIVK